MHCNICGNGNRIRLYYCNCDDCDICEDCINDNNMNCVDKQCEYRMHCKIYKKLLNKTNRRYTVSLTEEEILALPILLKMAETYTWDLYDKTPESRYWERHKYNKVVIDEYQQQGYQGIIAVGENVREKIKNIIGRIIE